MTRAAVGTCLLLLAFAPPLTAQLIDDPRHEGKHPDSDSQWVAIGEVQLRMGHRTEALAALKTAVSLNPANKSQLPRSTSLAELHGDPEFLAIVRQ